MAENSRIAGARRGAAALASRSAVLLGLALLALSPAAAQDYPPVRRGVALQFPRDHGSHPRFRNEWWYITGWVRSESGEEFGVQITFFRNRPGVAESAEGEFAPRQLLFAHAAISDPRGGRLLRDQRAARQGFGLAEAQEGATGVAIDDWSLKETAGGYAAEVAARDFRYALSFGTTQPPLLEGDRGFSRKGRAFLQASYYYSLPHLAVGGSVTIDGRRIDVKGEAWLDHEWSSQPLAEDAVGWDWTAVNLADGGALTAFRIRTRNGGTLWAGGAIRDAGGRVRALQPGEVQFTPLRRWRSPRTDVEYPVAMRVKAGSVSIELDPLMDDQEFDARASTGTVYWEGAVRATLGDKPAGRGYLEMTGYWKPLTL